MKSRRRKQMSMRNIQKIESCLFGTPATLFLIKRRDEGFFSFIFFFPLLYKKKEKGGSI
jgi:hypothetical protein